MTATDRCLTCGTALPANAPEGSCPACLMRLGLGGPALSLSHPGDLGSPISFEAATGQGRVLEALAATVGPMPCVLLRDTDAGFEPPVVRPGKEPGADSTGRYRIDGEIACGGMGTVLKGRDPDLGRDVALKVLREDLRDNPDMVRRFVEEAQIGGQLQHPGIVPIYELGTFTDRRPFFAMKLVKGHTLAALLEARKDPADERSRFLGIFEQVALTVAYAHARGVIHRDLKPSNVMVGNFGEVQVMDWGLAKVLPRGGVVDDASAGKTTRQETIIATARSGSDDSDLSQAGSVMGTPAYMAPEQARGETAAIDGRADVFALGSILCEILTGRPAFVGRSSGEIQRKAALGDTADALARLDASVADAELIALAKNCLAREPEDRPREAVRVAEVVTAYQNSVVERLRRAEVERAAEQVRVVEERRRRRVTVALAASVLATVLLGGGGAFWIFQDRQHRQASLDLAVQGAELLRDQAAAATTDAIPRWQEARLAVEKASGILGATSSAQAQARLASLQASVAKGIAAARADDQLVARLDQIRATLEGKQAHAAYAEAFRAAGLDWNAPEAMAERLKARPTAVREAVVTALEAWSVVTGEATDLKRLLAAARATDPADSWHNQLRDALEHKDLEGFRKLASRPEELARQGSVSLWLLGHRLETLGDHPLAVEVLRVGQRQYPGDYWLNLELGLALMEGRRQGPETDTAGLTIGAVEEKFRAAEPYLTAALALRPNFASAHNVLGWAFAMQGRWPEAIAAARRAISLAPDYSMAHNDLGLYLGRQGNWEEGLVEIRKALELDPQNPDAPGNLAHALFQLGKRDEAVVAYRKAIALHVGKANLYTGLGSVLLTKGDLEGAAAAFREAVRLEPRWDQARWQLGRALRQLNKPDEEVALQREYVAIDPQNGAAHHQLGDALRAQGKREEAIAEHRQAIALDPKHAWAHHNLGQGLREQGKLDEAIARFRRALALDPRNGTMQGSLIFALKSQNRIEEAIEVDREAIRLYPAIVGAHIRLGNQLIELGRLDEDLELQRAYVALDPKVGLAHLLLGDALRAQGKRQEAMAEHRQAIALNPKLQWAHYNLGLSLRDAGELDEAIVEFTKAVALVPNNATMRSTLYEVLRGQGRLAEAAEALRESIRVGPPTAAAHRRLGDLLFEIGRLDEAITSYRQATAIAPKNPVCLFALFNTLRLQGKTDEVVSECRRLLERDPDNGPARVFLGDYLRVQAQLEESLAVYESSIQRFPALPFAHRGAGLTLLEMDRGDEALSALRKAMALANDAFSRDLTRPDLDRVERLAAVQGKLPAFLEGAFQPQTVDERLGLAGLCRIKKRYAASARLYADAFAADPKLADDLKAGHRQRAAGCAAQAGTGQGIDAAELDEPQRVHWRKQALDWLRADLSLRTQQLEAGRPEDRNQVREALREVRVDPDLACIREPDSLAKHPEEEQTAWRAFWAEMDDLLKKAQGN